MDFGCSTNNLTFLNVPANGNFAHTAVSGFLGGVPRQISLGVKRTLETSSQIQANPYAAQIRSRRALFK